MIEVNESKVVLPYSIEVTSSMPEASMMPKLHYLVIIGVEMKISWIR